MDIRSLLDRHPFATFTLLAYGLSWVCWGAWAGLTGAPVLLRDGSELGGTPQGRPSAAVGG
jgi:hypothetical protein